MYSDAATLRRKNSRERNADRRKGLRHKRSEYIGTNTRADQHRDPGRSNETRAHFLQLSLPLAITPATTSSIITDKRALDTNIGSLAARAFDVDTMKSARLDESQSGKISLWTRRIYARKDFAIYLSLGGGRLCFVGASAKFSGRSRALPGGSVATTVNSFGIL